METETTPQTNLWNKKQTDMTVGDSLKIGVGATVVMTVLPFVVLGAVAGVNAICGKIRSRKAKEELPETPTELTTEK